MSLTHFVRCLRFAVEQTKAFQSMAKQKRPSRPPAQKKPPLTHFLCLPLVSPTSRPQLEASVAKFKAIVTSGVSSSGVGNAGVDQVEHVVPSVHPKAIRPVGALHCTLGVMSLKADELKAAVDLLTGLDLRNILTADQPSSLAAEPAEKQEDTKPASLERSITPPQLRRSTEPLKIELRGLESMHDPRKTSILYIAPSDPSDRLYRGCLALQKIFKDKGLLVEDNRALRMHATIVNTIYAKGRKLPRRAQQNTSSSSITGGADSAETVDDRSSGHGANANAPLQIDATQILEQYKEYVWAENVVLDRVAICEMGAKKIMDDQGNVKAEEYTEVASTPLPT